MRSFAYGLVLFAACADPQIAHHDEAGLRDAASQDRGYDDASDIGSLDLGPPDFGSPDVGSLDLGSVETGVRDAEERDLGLDATVMVDQDLDQDGLDDRDEARWAQAYLPYLSVAANDRCPLAVGLYRIRPHPLDGTLLHYLLIVLFERDCGASSHIGDNEVIGMTIDPQISGPEGILTIRAISHQATPCEHVSECSLHCGDACATRTSNGAEVPVVFYSRNKHGAYLVEEDCDGACFLTNYCSLADEPFVPRLFNAGEPAYPLIRNLTDAGAITSTAGWSEWDVFNFDPWGPEEFGTAGIVSDDLVDPAFVTPACR